MTDYDFSDMGALETAILAADGVLAAVDPNEPRLATAARVTLAVLPEILDQIEVKVQEANLEVAQARSSTQIALAQMDAATEAFKAQSARLQMVAEEINPVSVAQQIIGEMDRAGFAVDGRQGAMIETAVAQTIRRVLSSFGFALSIEPEDDL